MQRIFVNAAIKKALCREAKGDRSWLYKVRPMVRPRLPLPHPHQMPARRHRVRRPTGADGGDGCSAGDLAYWFKDSVLHPKPPPKEPPKPKPPITLAQMPPGCKGVLNAPDAKVQ